MKKWQDIPGWLDEERAKTLAKLIKHYNINMVIEIGAFLGRSTVFFASQKVNVINTPLGVIAVDPFVMWQDGRINQPTVKEQFGIGEDFFENFVLNIEAAEKTQLVCPFRMDSKHAYRFLKGAEKNYRPLVYIDGAHDYESVREDIKMFREMALVICGDDYSDHPDHPWPGVKEAVDDLVPHKKVEGQIWYYVKDNQERKRGEEAEKIVEDERLENL